MTVGQKIKKLRIEKGLTQKDLSEQVFVTFQTVSKWENDENEPDISTLRELAKLFGCSLDYLLSEDEEVKKEEEEKKPAPAPVTQTIIIREKEAHVCARCHKDIEGDDFSIENLYKSERHGRTSSRKHIGERYYHKACWEEEQKIRKENEERNKRLHAKRARKFCFGWGIGGGVAAFGIALAIFLCNTQYVHPGIGVALSVIIGYAIFSMLYCIISGSYIADVFLWGSSLSIKLPGLIFSWDLEGFIWVISMKILFAIITFLFGIFTLVLAVTLSGTLGMFSFPFILIHNNHTQYSDALVK